MSTRAKMCSNWLQGTSWLDVAVVVGRHTQARSLDRQPWGPPRLGPTNGMAALVVQTEASRHKDTTSRHRQWNIQCEIHCR